ncbi:MAG: suppressor of fused domain protein [Weeksellaceae bacterium]
MNNEDIFERIEHWYEGDEHQKIVDLITTLPKEEQTPELISELGRAYNNLYWANEDEDFEKAKSYLNKAEEVLLSVKQDLIEDYRWHYRIAYTYFYLDNAPKSQYHFEESQKLSGEDYSEYLNAIALAKEKEISLSDAIYEIWEQSGQFNTPQAFYEPEEIEHLEDFIEVNYGKIESVFHELVSPDIHCDIYVIKPTAERNYYTLITGGMGAYEMNIPEGFEAPTRAELMINLPPDWDITNEEERWYWPLRWLKVLARLPIEQNTFLGWGHTIPTGEPLEGTNFDCIMLVTTPNQMGDVVDMELSEHKTVTFYTLFPLFPEETLFKLDHDATELLGKFDEIDIPYPPVVDLDRPNACLNYEPKEQLHLLDNVYWTFTPKVYDTLMNFVVAVKAYNIALENDLTNTNPFATIFTSSQVKVMYEAYIQSKEDLLEHETLLMEEETFNQTAEDGYYQATILATLKAEQENTFGSLELLLKVHNSLANKELGDHVFFEGFEIQGYEEDGTPVIFLPLGS